METPVYWDSSVIVSYALQDPKRVNAVREAVKDSKLILTSELSIVETAAGAVSQMQSQVSDRLSSALQNLNVLFQSFQMLKVSGSVLAEARKLVLRYRVSHGLRSADAVHLASWNLYCDHLALPEKRTAFFITADKKQFTSFTAEGHVGRLIE